MMSSFGTFKLTEENIEDIVVAALEGGIGYWACLDNTLDDFSNLEHDECISERAAKILLDGGAIRFTDVEDEESEYWLSLGMLLDGIETFVSNGWDKYRTFTEDHEVDLCFFDAESADVLFQLALFGDIIYG